MFRKPSQGTLTRTQGGRADVLGEWFSTRSAPPRRHVAVSGDRKGCHKGHLVVEAREAAIHRTQDRPPPPRTQSELAQSAPVQRLRNLALDPSRLGLSCHSI